jgi:hypothetical protein
MKKQILLGAAAAALLVASASAAVAQSGSSDTTVTSVPLPADTSNLRPGGMAGAPAGLGTKITLAVNGLFGSDKHEDTKLAQSGSR